MQNVMFSPQGNQDSDVVALTLSKISRTILVAVFGLLPIFFVPLAYAPFNFSKTLFVIVGVFVALVFYSLSLLRQGTITVKSSVGIWAAWGLVLVTLVAALLSGDIRDAILGETIGIHTVAFVGLLAFIVSITTILSTHKTSVMNLYVLLTGSGLAIGLFQVLRILFGPEALTLGIFTSATATPLGGWNDLALFFGLAVLLALVAVEQFPLTKWGRVLFGVVSVVSLVVLAVVNFFAIWVVLGLVSLIVLMYSLTKNRFAGNTLSLDKEDSAGGLASIILSIAVFIVSAAFVIGGSGIGQMISSATGISYVEVRPSMSATLDITRSVYQENAFVGIGPNKFIDAWRLYKDPAINQTVFWNTPFEAGVGYIPTFAVTTGIFGVIAWFIFLSSIVYVGFRLLFSVQHVDRFWYFIGISSLVSALYLWGMSIIYVPGPTVLLLAAVFTGILFASYSAMLPQRSFSISLLQNKRLGFALVAITMVVIIGSVSALFFAGRQYSALISFNHALASIPSGTPIETVERGIADAYELFPNDRFAREILGIQLSKLNALFNLSELTDAQQQQLESIIVNAVNAGQLGVQQDPTEPLNWLGLGNVYSLLVVAGIDGAYDRAKEAFATAKEYDPQSALIALQEAQLEGRAGNLDTSRELALNAVRLKPNYTDALSYIAEVDIARGDVQGAIASTRANITLEPNNAARYYQLGILYTADGDQTAAAQAFERAVAIDPNYANARYFLALTYDQLGRSADAKGQLERVLELNPGNEAVSQLLARLAEGLPLSDIAPSTNVVPEASAGVDGEGDVTTDTDVNSPLLTPVNTVPGDTETDASETQSETNESETASSSETTPATE
ncbi:tetratricopeptide repeat protein [Candidatus Pacebacteria bacterium]|nr:tetratricopeptide repeat protein [Candidatus Paceibacterota bacterium]